MDFVKKWIENAKNNIPNNSFLLISFDDNKYKEELESITGDFLIKPINRFKEDIGRNTILTTNKGNLSFRFLSVLKNSSKDTILCCNFLDIRSYFNQSYFNQSYPQNFYINKFRLNFYNISADVAFAKNNLIPFYFNTNKNLNWSFSKQQINNIFFKNKNFDIDKIKLDIAYFERESVLTSRLSIIIYKIFTFDFYTSDTKIGKLFANHFGKSKLFNCKNFHIKNTRGYKIPNFQNTEFNIRFQIADNLYYREKCQDLQMISRVVDIGILVLRQRYNV